MIYTCTLNPSLDLYMEFKKPLEKGKTNRSELEYYEAGGKGINVSIVLNNLMIPSRAFGFVGGFTKEFYIELLQKYSYIEPSFTYIEGHTRINLKLKDTELETDLNAMGPYITKDAMESLSNKISRLYENDILVVSGNILEYLEDDMVSLIKKTSEENIKIILDTNSDVVSKCLNFKPFLCNLSLSDLEDITNNKFVDYKINDLINPIKEVVNSGASNVIVELGENGALFGCLGGVYYSDVAQKEKIVNTVGSSDSMVAGFIMNSLRSSDVVDSFKYASCCYLATSFSKTLASRENVNRLYDEVSVVKID